MLPDFGDPKITRAVEEIVAMLAEKGAEYRNASLAPVYVASDLSPEQRIRARIDEKLARLRAHPTKRDTILDLAGCFTLLLAVMDGTSVLDEGARPRVAPIPERRVGIVGALAGPHNGGGAEPLPYGYWKTEL